MGDVGGIGGGSNFIKDDLKVNKNQEKPQTQSTEPKETEIKPSKDDVSVSKLKNSKFDPANSSVNIGELLEKSKKHEPGSIGGGIKKHDIPDYQKNTTLAYGEEGGTHPGKIEFPKDIDIGEIFKKQSPGDMVEDIRNAQGGKRDDALLGFQDKLDKMNPKELKVMRDYLVTAMADPKNKDDELLGSLLNKVNHELDSRPTHSPIFEMTKMMGENGTIAPIIRPHIMNLDLDNLHAVTKSPGEGAELFTQGIKEHNYSITQEALDSVINEKKKD